MADYYTLFSHKLAVTKAEATWLDRLIRLPFDKARKILVDQFPIQYPEMDWGLWPFFDFEWGLPEGRRATAYFSSTDSGSPLMVAYVLRAFFSKFRRNDIDTICVAYTSSNNAPDSLNGEEIIVSAKHIILGGDVTRMIYETLRDKKAVGMLRYEAKEFSGITIRLETDT